MNAADAERKRVNGVNASSPRQNTPRSSPPTRSSSWRRHAA